MDELDLRVRNRTYRLFADLGRAPRPAEVGLELELDAAEVERSWRRLHEAHALVLERDRAEIRMANPFSAVPTAYRVEAAGRRWFANCAWDAFGICAALHADGRLSSACPDCGAGIEVYVSRRRPAPDDHVFHVLVPARHWWDDIVFT